MTMNDDREALRDLIECAKSGEMRWPAEDSPGCVIDVPEYDELLAALAREKLAALDAPEPKRWKIDLSNLSPREMGTDDAPAFDEAKLRDDLDLLNFAGRKHEVCIDDIIHCVRQTVDLNPRMTEQAVREALSCYIQPSVTEMIDELRDLGAFAAMSREPRQAEKDGSAEMSPAQELKGPQSSAGAEHPAQMTATERALAAHAAAEREVRELERQIINLTKQRNQETYLRRAAQERVEELVELVGRIFAYRDHTSDCACAICEHDRAMLVRHTEGT